MDSVYRNFFPFIFKFLKNSSHFTLIKDNFLPLCLMWNLLLKLLPIYGLNHKHFWVSIFHQVNSVLSWLCYLFSLLHFQLLYLFLCLLLPNNNIYKTWHWSHNHPLFYANLTHTKHSETSAVCNGVSIYVFPLPMSHFFFSFESQYNILV